jgi:hypothetical protein
MTKVPWPVGGKTRLSSRPRPSHALRIGRRESGRGRGGIRGELALHHELVQEAAEEPHAVLDRRGTTPFVRPWSMNARIAATSISPTERSPKNGDQAQGARLETVEAGRTPSARSRVSRPCRPMGRGRHG